MVKKILITGISGFIGSACARGLMLAGYDIYGLDLFPLTPSFAVKKFVQGEVTVENLKLFGDDIDIILHFAGSPTVGAVIKDPTLEYRKTVISTKNVLDFISSSKRNIRVIYSSSAAVYGDNYDRPIMEDDKLNPISDYGKYKVEVENMCKDYHQKYGIDVGIVRFFSIYGPGLKKQFLWDFSGKILKNIQLAEIPCFGTGREKRDFLYISDVISLVQLLMESPFSFMIVNGGTQQVTQIKEIMQKISKEFNFNGSFNFDGVERLGDPLSLVANMQKAQTLGFVPQIDINKGVHYYVDWFKQNY